MSLSWDDTRSNLEEVHKYQHKGIKQDLTQATCMHYFVLSLGQQQRIK